MLNDRLAPNFCESEAFVNGVLPKSQRQIIKVKFDKHTADNIFGHLTKYGFNVRDHQIALSSSLLFSHSRVRDSLEQFIETHTFFSLSFLMNFQAFIIVWMSLSPVLHVEYEHSLVLSAIARKINLRV